MNEIDRLEATIQNRINESRNKMSIPVLVSIQTLREMLFLVKKRQGEKPVHYHDEWNEHDWETEEDGSIDEWAFESEDSIHHGPMCKRCGYSFCVLCYEDGYNNKQCVVEKNVCPSCGDPVFSSYKFCTNCGQKLEWE